MKKSTKQNVVFASFLIVAVAVINLRECKVVEQASDCTIKQLLSISQCQAEITIKPPSGGDLILPFSIDDMTEEEIAYFKRRMEALK